MYPTSLDYTNPGLLTMLMLLPFFGACCMFFVPVKEERFARLFASIFAFSSLLLSCLIASDYTIKSSGYQFVEKLPFITNIGADYVVGIDGLSLVMLLLTTAICFLVILASSSVHKNIRSYLGCILFLETGMIGTFIALDALTFYVFWEIMLVPMYFIIGVWGGERRVYAAIKFVLYTAIGSILMLVAMVYVAYQSQLQFGQMTFYLGDWLRLSFSPTEQLYLFIAFALAFAIKIPVFPFHTWLPDAHVEAPTGGSVILAAVMLKMGVYGLVRYAIPLFPEGFTYCLPVIFLLGVVGIVLGALFAWVQTDIKKLIAYSSVSHLGFCVVGLCAFNFDGIQGALLQLVNHGVSTGALFLLVGVLYDRRHTRLISDYGGLAKKVPHFATLFLIFTLSSIGLPLTNGFIGEFMVLAGSYQADKVYGLIAVSGVVLGALYMLSLYRRVVFGELDQAKNGELTDITFTERLVFAPLLVAVFALGLFPTLVLDLLEPTSRNLISEVGQR